MDAWGEEEGLTEGVLSGLDVVQLTTISLTQMSRTKLKTRWTERSNPWERNRCMELFLLMTDVSFS